MKKERKYAIKTADIRFCAYMQKIKEELKGEGDWAVSLGFCVSQNDYD